MKFSPRVMEIGKKLAERMRSKGLYIALHLRLEKDVWVRTGCLTGLSSKYGEIARLEGIKRPELLTAKSTLTPNERKLAGLCPLNAKEVRRLVSELLFFFTTNTILYCPMNSNLSQNELR